MATRNDGGDMDCDLSHARAVAVEAAEAAGDVVRARLFRHFEVHEKGDAGDVVTELDYAAEKVVVSRIQAAFPGHRVISEEMGGVDGAADAPDGGAARWTWLIDPVDGTNNVVIGLPVLAVGIALCRDGVPVVSAVHDPVSRRTWSAARGRGAWIATGDAACHPLHTPKVEGHGRRRPLLAWIQGYAVGRDDATARAMRALVADRAHRVLDLWAPLTCWTMLARGDIDGIVGYRIGEIDLHAGALIATETGLHVRDFSGGPYDARLHGLGLGPGTGSGLEPPDEQSLLAGSAEMVAELAAMVPVARRTAAGTAGRT